MKQRDATMDGLLPDDLYVVSTEEILWGGALLAMTLILHGLGMVLTLRTCKGLRRWLEALHSHSLLLAAAVLVVAAWMIVLVNVTEISMWAGFYVWRGALDNAHAAFYYALVNYTTLDSGYLPQRWRLLEGILAMAGLLTVAWSTGILLVLAQQFQARVMGTDAKADRPRADDDEAGA